MRAFLDWLDVNWPLLAIAAGLVAVVALLWLSIYANQVEHEAFMRECLKDRKQYECLAMWRGGSGSRYPIIVPVVPIR